jgi:HlyD family secretion protein
MAAIGAVSRVRRWAASHRALALAGVVSVVALSAWTARAFRGPSHPVVTSAEITTGPIVRRIIATGTLQPVVTVQVGAQVSGTIQSLGADFNSIVHAGQVVARIDPALFEAALRQAEAALQQAEAAQAQAVANEKGYDTAVEDAQMKLKRAEALGATHLIPQSDLDAAHIAMDQANADDRSGASQIVQAKAAVDQARAALEQAKVNLDHTVITSPIDGIVVSRDVDVGQTVAASVQAPTLFEIASDLTRMQVEVDIDEADVGGIDAGEPVTFQVDSYPGETFHGTVTAVRLQPVAQQTTAATAVGTPSAATTTSSSSTTSTAPAATSTSNLSAGTMATVISYATMVQISNEDEKLRPGMTAVVTLSGSRRAEAVRIPNGALAFRPTPDVLSAGGQATGVLSAANDPVDDPTRRHVWRYDGTQFVAVPVRVGLADNQWTELVSGPLGKGDPVIVEASLAGARR